MFVHALARRREHKPLPFLHALGEAILSSHDLKHTMHAYDAWILAFQASYLVLEVRVKGVLEHVWVPALKLGHTMMRVGLAVHGAGACMGDVTGATHK
jgi:ABC-type cobalamin transport system ATPase subunit